METQPCRLPLFSPPSGDPAVSAVLHVQVYVTAGQSYELESKLWKLEQSAKNRFGGTTDSDLSELEDVVALTAARVQSAESEVGGGCETGVSMQRPCLGNEQFLS